MNKKQRGFGMVQAVAAMAALSAVASIAVPAYEDFLTRSKMSEAFTLASDSKNKLAEFYAATSRWPKKASERDLIYTEAYTPPEFVEEVKVNYESKVHDIVIEVYFKQDAIPGTVYGLDHLYMAGNVDDVGVIQWTCAAEGIENRYLPDYCHS